MKAKIILSGCFDQKHKMTNVRVSPFEGTKDGFDGNVDVILLFILQSFYLSSQNTLTVYKYKFTSDKRSLTVYNI